ncbi:hypothetical protein LZ30DRAFT_743124 [Colletotrichum cereale]|nr:hypothetical protein LZ30DRAFT_743124 [Colletotrichum cereale]
MSSEFQSLLISHLKTASTFKRPPKNLRKSFKLTFQQKQHQQDTHSIFLRVGFHAWLSCLLTENATQGKRKYRGKTSDRSLFLRLQKASTEEKQHIAQSVCGKRLNEQIEAKIKEWEESCRSDMNVISSPGSDTSIGATVSPETTNSQLSDPNLGENRGGSVLAARTAIHQEAGVTEGSDPACGGTLLPPAISITRIFPPYMCSAIIKDIWSSAMLQMSFPDNPSDDCLMTLSILPNKVEYLAMALFGIHLESENELRHVVLGNGSCIIPSDQIQLDGVEEKASDEILGLATSRAVQVSLKRTMEIGNACTRTKCITMTVSKSYNTPASLSLTLGLEEGLRLRHLMFDF